MSSNKNDRKNTKYSNIKKNENNKNVKYRIKEKNNNKKMVRRRMYNFIKILIVIRTRIRIRIKIRRSMQIIRRMPRMWIMVMIKRIEITIRRILTIKMTMWVMIIWIMRSISE